MEASERSPIEDVKLTSRTEEKLAQKKKRDRETTEQYPSECLAKEIRTL